MSNENQQVAKFKQAGGVSAFSGENSFNLSIRMAQALSNSNLLVPEAYRGPNGVANCLIAIEMASRTGVSPLMVIQNLHVVNGKPGWSSVYMIAQINNSKLFSTRLKFTYTKNAQGGWNSCTAWAKDLEGDIVEGDEITIKMAVDEGWWGKKGSKWPTMTKQMLSYRAAAFFCRLHCPEILIGMPTSDEILDIDYEGVSTSNAPDPVNKINEEIKQKLEAQAEIEREQKMRNETDSRDIKGEFYKAGVIQECENTELPIGYAVKLYRDYYGVDPEAMIPEVTIINYRAYMAAGEPIAGETEPMDIFAFIEATAPTKGTAEAQDDATSEEHHDAV